jgi:hypothetical protein
MLAFIKIMLNRKRLQQLSAEYWPMQNEAEWMLRLVRAANHMGEIYIKRNQYALAHAMFERGNTRLRYAERLIARCEANTDEYARLSS